MEDDDGRRKKNFFKLQMQSKTKVKSLICLNIHTTFLMSKEGDIIEFQM